MTIETSKNWENLKIEDKEDSTSTLGSETVWRHTAYYRYSNIKLLTITADSCVVNTKKYQNMLSVAFRLGVME